MTKDALPGFRSATLFTAATRRIGGNATVFHLDGDRFGVMHDPRGDRGLGGALEARSREVVPMGATVSVGFEATEMTARRGEVVHCDPCEGGWKVGIRLADAA